MRISDWSSDVCSSDLLALHHAVVELGLLHLLHLRPGHAREHAHQAGEAAHLLHLLELLGEVIEVEGALLKLARERSEEHTSELQSLMRISYAVFCLKKKTNI